MLELCCVTVATPLPSLGLASLNCSDSLAWSHFGLSQGFCHFLPVGAHRMAQWGHSEYPSSAACWEGLGGSKAAIPESLLQAESRCSARHVADQTAPPSPALALFDGEM